MRLGVNVDHIAVLKAARKFNDPDVLQSVFLAQRGGAEQITIHLREDRRHIDDYDAERIVCNSPLPVNIECAFEMIDAICDLRPIRATLVPEKREEVTTEGGLDVERNFAKIKQCVEKFAAREIEVSLFIEPNKAAVDLAYRSGATMVEFHTGRYANIYAMLYGNLARTPYAIDALNTSRNQLRSWLAKELDAIGKAAEFARKNNLAVAAGHGLNYQNVGAIRAIEAIEELNIGQSIVARSVFVGFERAVREMSELTR
ncbi:MAG: pyridoxine 5'-phosphate synthase [Helicobacteraceae bacterium]|jgi:pyridoxine 5-phosphate synthase|nr:pyridoxine 5'-phosphate synthase [Helicobacteraceae bacterium]